MDTVGVHRPRLSSRHLEAANAVHEAVCACKCPHTVTLPWAPPHCRFVAVLSRRRREQGSREDTALMVEQIRLHHRVAMSLQLLCSSPGQLVCIWAPFVFLLLLTLKLDGVRWVVLCTYAASSLFFQVLVVNVSLPQLSL